MSRWKTHRWRSGERHPKARISDHDVDLMRDLHEEHGLSIPEIASKFHCPYDTAYDICKYRSRCAES